MIVKIIKCDTDSFWYSKCVGLRFEVENRKIEKHGSKHWKCIRCLDIDKISNDKISNDKRVSEEIRYNNFSSCFVMCDDVCSRKEKLINILK